MKKFYFLLLAAVFAVSTALANEDYTSSIVNPECSGTKPGKVDGWTITGNVPNLAYVYGDYFEYWKLSPADAQYDYYQVINNLPSGKYVISATVFLDQSKSEDENQSGIYGSTLFEEVRGKATVQGEQVCETQAINVTDGKLRIGFKNFGPMSFSWTYAKNFHLERVGDAESVVLQKGQDVSAAFGDWVLGGNVYNGGKEHYQGSVWTGDVLYQSISGLPAGNYLVTFKAMASTTVERDKACGGKAATVEDQACMIYANGTQQYIPVIVQTGFAESDFTEYTLNALVSGDGVLKFGIKATELAGNWFVAKAVSLVYDGAVDLSVLKAAYAEAKAEADAIKNEPMNRDVKQELDDALNLQPENTADSYNEVIGKISAAVAAAQVSVKNYQELYAAFAQAYTFDPLGQMTFFAVPAVDRLYNYYQNAAFVAMTAEDKAAISEAMAIGAKAQTSKGANMTAAIVNPTIDGNADGWTMTKDYGGGGPLKPSGDALEYWAGSANPRTSAEFTISQEIVGLRAGIYEVTAEVFNSLNGEGGAVFNPSCAVYAQSGTDVGLGLVDVEGEEFKPYSAQVIVEEGQSLIIGVKSVDKMGARWIVADNFTLKYLGKPDLTVYKEKYAAAKAKITEELLGTPMNAEIAKKLGELKKAAEPTTQAALIAATQDINDNLAEAEKSVKFYENVGDALTLDEVEALDEDGQAAFKAVAEPYAQAVLAGTLDETKDYVTIIKNAYIAAVKAQGAGADMTVLMPNAWELRGPRNYGALNVNEHYETFAYEGDALYQKIDGLKPGVYSVTFRAAASATLEGRDITDGRPAEATEKASVVFANDAEQGLEVVDRLNVADAEFATFTVEGEVGEDGILKYGIKNNAKAGNWFIAKEVSLKYLGEAEKAPVTEPMDITVSQIGYNTLTAAKNIDIAGSGLKAYIATSASGNTIKLTSVEKLVAGNAYLIAGTASKTYTVTATEEEFDAPVVNYFVPVSETITIGEKTGAYTNCYLGVDKNGENPGFYMVDGQITISAGKAYLSAPIEVVAGQSIVIEIEDEDATLVSGVAEAKNSVEGAYTVAGIKTKSAKGIIISDGKKYIAE